MEERTDVSEVRILPCQRQVAEVVKAIISTTVIVHYRPETEKKHAFPGYCLSLQRWDIAAGEKAVRIRIPEAKTREQRPPERPGVLPRRRAF